MADATLGHRRPSNTPIGRTHLFLATGFMAGLLLLAAVSVTTLWPMARSEWMLLRTRWQIDQWSNGLAPYPGIVAWGKARSTLADALAIHPDPQSHEALGYLYASQSQLQGFDPDLARAYLEQAAQHYRQALALRPMAGVTWANLALALHRQTLGTEQPPPPGLWTAFDQAMAFARREPAAQLILTDIALARWAQLAPERQTALADMLTNHANILAQQPLYDMLVALDRLDLAPTTWEAAASHVMPEFGMETEYWPKNAHTGQYRDPADLVDERTRRIEQVLNGPNQLPEAGPTPTGRER